MNRFDNFNEYVNHKEVLENSYNFMLGEINKGYKMTLIFIFLVITIVALYIGVKEYKKYRVKKIKLAKKKAYIKRKYNI